MSFNLDIWLDNRIVKCARISTKLTQLKSKYNDIYAAKKEIFKKITKIGAGSCGQIYITELDNDFIVMKKDMKTNDTEEEYTLLLLSGQLMSTNKCPNFLYPFLENISCKNNGKLIFMELATGDLSEVSPFITEKSHQKSILFQLLIAVHFMETEYGIFHTDIKQENILIIKLPPGDRFHYIVDGVDYYIDNVGFLPCIADFGLAESFSPVWNVTGYLGERNAIVKKGTSEYVPVISDVFLSFSDNTSLITVKKPVRQLWKDGLKGTRNRLRELYPINLKPEINYYDFVFAPAFEFSHDIIDIIRIFIGGKRTIQFGKHTGFLELDPDIRTKLTSIDFKRKSYHGTAFGKTDIFYTNAFEMYKKLHHLIGSQ